MAFEQYLSKRAQAVKGSAGRQTSVSESDVINLGSGTPDFEPPAFIFEAVQKALDTRQIHYTPWLGLPALREAIAGKLERENRLSVDPDKEVLVTTGAQEALTTTLLTLLDPDDEVLIPSPHYAVYSRVASIAGASMIPVATTPESNFTIDAASLEAALTPRTKLIIIVSPNNPTGTVIPEKNLREIAALAVKKDLLVISDEIYEHYLFDDHKHVSLATLPGMRERTVTINSLSKGFALTGLRIGYLSAPEALIDAMLPFHHSMTICAPVLSQYAAIAALSQPRDWFTPILEEYDRRRQAWIHTLESLGLSSAHPQGAYYIFANIQPSGLTGTEFSRRLRSEAKVTMGAGGSGPGEYYLRGSLMQTSPQLEQGLQRFQNFTQDLINE